MDATELEKWMRVSDAARRLEVTLQMVRVWAAQGRLTSIRTPYGLLLEPGSVERLAQERQEKKSRRGG